MKKILIILLVSSFLLFSSCGNKNGLNNKTTETTIVETTQQESTTTRLPTASELVFWGSREGWELGQKNMKVLSEKFDFDDEYLKDFAFMLVEAGVKEIKEITVEEVGVKSEIVLIKDITDEVYYILFGEYHRGNVCTEEEWEMAEKHKSVISENFDFDDQSSQNIAEILAKSGIQEIKSLNVEEYQPSGTSESYPVTRIEDVTNTIYYASIATESEFNAGYVYTIRKGSWENGEDVYDAYIGYTAD